tara:strand:- start:75 stop:380 length:306 start_codon:yes stop_codon:yes gene_type:complete
MCEVYITYQRLIEKQKDLNKIESSNDLGDSDGFDVDVVVDNDDAIIMEDYKYKDVVCCCKHTKAHNRSMGFSLIFSDEIKYPGDTKIFNNHRDDGPLNIYN